MFEYDKLQLYRGRDIKINNNLIIKIPTIGQIEEFGEQRYFNAIYNFTSVGADLKWQLWDIGIDYTEIKDYDLFINLICQLVSSKKHKYEDMILNPDKYDEKPDKDEMLTNPLQLVMPDVDFADFKRYKIDGNEEIVLYNHEKDITFDRLAYMRVMEVIRDIHGLKRNNQIPANERTKMDLIEDARDDSMLAASKPFQSVLLPLVSTVQTYCGQCGDDKIWNTPISAFLDNVKRIGKIQDADHLLQGAYSGFASLKGIDRDRLDIFGNI